MEQKAKCVYSIGTIKEAAQLNQYYAILVKIESYELNWTILEFNSIPDII